MIRREGRFWLVDIHVRHQGRIKRKFVGEEEARIFLERKQALNNKPDPAEVRGESVGTLFPFYALKLWQGTKDERNAVRIATELAETLGDDKSIKTITSKDVERLRDEFVRKGNAKRTINSKLSRLSKLLKHAHKLEMVDKLPHIDFEKVTGGRRRFLTDQEEEALLARLDEPYRSFFLFLLYTGCRPGEALNMRWSDISENRVTFWETKTNRNRYVPLVSIARDAIPWVWKDQQIRPFAHINYDRFYNAFIAARKLAGLDQAVVPYTLRHTFASRMAKLTKGDFVLLKEWMGHTSLTTTMNYTHLESDALTGPAALLEEQIRNKNSWTRLLQR